MKTSSDKISGMLPRRASSAVTTGAVLAACLSHSTFQMP